MAELLINVDVKGANQLNTLDDKLKKTESSAKKATSSLKGMGVVLGAVIGSQAIRGLINYSDTWTNIESKLKLVTTSTANLMTVQSDLFQVAERSRQSFEATATLYARMSRATKDLHVNQKDLLTVTETINKALVVSGASAQESASTITQLSQAMASGVLRGEEYNSISENGARINEIFAKSLGVTNGELRKLAKEGKITTEVMMKALLEETKNVNAEFNQMNLTIGQAVQSFDNNLGQVLSSTTGAMGNLAISIKWVGEALKEANEYYFGDPALAAYAKRIQLEQEFYASQRKLLEVEKESVPVKDDLLTKLTELANEEKRHAEYLEDNAYKTQDAKDFQAQLRAEYEATHPALDQNTKDTQANTQAKKEAIATTQALAQAKQQEAQASASNSSGGSGSTYTVFIPYSPMEKTLMNLNKEVKNLSSSLSYTNPVLATFENSMNTVNEKVKDMDNGVSDFLKGINDFVSDLSNALTSISGMLSEDYSGRARSSLFGGTKNDLSFKQAKATAEEAWKKFESDTFNEDYLRTYNKRMDELIGTLDEFNDTSKYNSKAEQDFAKHLALRQVQGFQDAQLDTRGEVDKQLEYLEAIKNATESTDGTTKTTKSIQEAIKNGTYSIKDLTKDTKAISQSTSSDIGRIETKTKANASTDRNQWVVKSETPKYNMTTSSYYDRNLGYWVTRDYKNFVGVTHTYGWVSASGSDRGYKKGGYTGNMGVDEVAGQVHGQEYVVNAQTTKDLGLNGSAGVFQQINAKLDMLQHLYEINKTSKRALSAQKQELDLKLKEVA